MGADSIGTELYLRKLIRGRLYEARGQIKTRAHTISVLIDLMISVLLDTLCRA